MEIPAWAMTVFETVTGVLESPGVNPVPEEVTSMDLMPWIDSLLVEIPELIQNFRANIFPQRFLTNVLGLSPGTVASLPLLLTLFVVLYLACGGATVYLRFKRGQRSMLSLWQQLVNFFFSWCGVLLLPLASVLFHGRGDGWFYPLIGVAAAAGALWFPLISVYRYLRYHRLPGIPHMIFDVGFGPFTMAILLLSCRFGTRALFALIVVAVLALLAVQWGGNYYLYDYDPLPQELPDEPEPAVVMTPAPPPQEPTPPPPQEEPYQAPEVAYQLSDILAEAEAAAEEFTDTPV